MPKTKKQVKTPSFRAYYLIIILAVAVIAGSAGWIARSVTLKPVAPSQPATSFEECKADAGSVILETYPEQCVTEDGQTFTGPTL